MRRSDHAPAPLARGLLAVAGEGALDELHRERPHPGVDAGRSGGLARGPRKQRRLLRERLRHLGDRRPRVVGGGGGRPQPQPARRLDHQLADGDRVQMEVGEQVAAVLHRRRAGSSARSATSWRRTSRGVVRGRRPLGGRPASSASSPSALSSPSARGEAGRGAPSTVPISGAISQGLARNLSGRSLIERPGEPPLEQDGGGDRHPQRERRARGRAAPRRSRVRRRRAGSPARRGPRPPARRGRGRDRPRSRGRRGPPRRAPR